MIIKVMHLIIAGGGGSLQGDGEKYLGSVEAEQND
jgi:hypothetical protein